MASQIDGEPTELAAGSIAIMRHTSGNMLANSGASRWRRESSGGSPASISTSAVQQHHRGAWSPVVANKRALSHENLRSALEPRKDKMPARVSSGGAAEENSMELDVELQK